VTADDKDIVDTLKSALAARIGPHRFAVWFGGNVRMAVADGRLLIAAVDQFRLDRLRGLRQELDGAMHQVLDRSLPVEFRIDASLADPPAETPATKTRREVRRHAKPVESREIPPRIATPRPRMRLDDFVSGSHARVAFAAACETVARPGAVTPLLLYGPTGSGKTHLLEGIAEAIRAERRLRRVLLLSAEQFTTEFIEGLKGKGLPSFRNKYRGVDMLLLDGIQFILGKRSTLGEFQYTVDTLMRAGKQLVLTADRPLSEMSGFGRELIARLSHGLVCGLDLPDAAARLEIARRMAQARGIEIPEDVLQKITREVDGDPRQLSGAVNRLRAASIAWKRPIDAEMAATSLGDICQAAVRVVDLQDVEGVVCEIFGVDSQQLHSHRKSKAISQPRTLAMWLARKLTRAPYAEIGAHFGGRSHSTVISAERKVREWVDAGAKIQLGCGECQVNEAIRRLELRIRTG
jgi:chromosomal replication initiator protein